MSESSPEMSVRTESASSSPTEAVKACIAGLQAIGFDRPRSLSPDAYLTALADLHTAWAPDLASLGAFYAERRFGDRVTVVEPPTILVACERVAAETGRLRRSAEIRSLQEAWRLRFSMPQTTENVTPVSAESVPSCPEAIVPDLEAIPTLPSSEPSSSRAAALRPASRLSGHGLVRLSSVEESVRRFGERTVSLRSAAGALIASATLASVGTIYAPQGLEKFVAAFTTSADVVMSPESPIAVVSQSPVSIGAMDAEDPGWPRLVPATHPHANKFNDVIADTLSELAKLYREIGRPERAAAIYSYVADARPEDVAAQLDYADYLLNPENPEHRDADRSCAYAERAYAQAPADPRAAETLSAALFATGDVSRAVAVQEAWRDRERPSGIVLNAEEPPRTAQSAG